MTRANIIALIGAFVVSIYMFSNLVIAQTNTPTPTPNQPPATGLGGMN